MELRTEEGSEGFAASKEVGLGSGRRRRELRRGEKGGPRFGRRIVLPDEAVHLSPGGSSARRILVDDQAAPEAFERSPGDHGTVRAEMSFEQREEGRREEGGREEEDERIGGGYRAAGRGGGHAG